MIKMILRFVWMMFLLGLLGLFIFFLLLLEQLPTTLGPHQ